MNPYQLLANAIIIRAVQDYRIALRNWNKNNKDSDFLLAKLELEEFFLSGWFGVLTDLDGELLMKNIQKMVLGKVVTV